MADFLFWIVILGVAAYVVRPLGRILLTLLFGLFGFFVALATVAFMGTMFLFTLVFGRKRTSFHRRQWTNRGGRSKSEREPSSREDVIDVTPITIRGDLTDGTDRQASI